MITKVLKIKVGGQAGQGIKSAGLLIAKIATRSGYNIYNYIEYPSLIRGGHNVMQVNISRDVVTGPSRYTDFLIALNQDTITKHIGELTSDSGILFDASAKMDTSSVPQGVKLFAIPLAQIARDAGGKELLSNTVALGAMVCLLGADLSIFKLLLKEEFGNKGEEVLGSNYKAADAGYKYVLDNYASFIKSELAPVNKSTAKPDMILNGDEAVALGAISAGLQFASIYPMSPISNILQVLAAHQQEYNYVYKQPEDEISAIGMAIGASYAGARAMTASSGGGFSLMVEGYGLAGMIEVPLVVIEGMRGGPATGLPTWSEQGDLRFVLHAHQGEFPRIVLAAGDAQEAFYLTMEAFYIADKYQTPVVLLIDKNICDNDQSIPGFEVEAYHIDRGKFTTKKVQDYKRYDLSPDGVSLRSVPGSGNFFITNSDEHDVYGLSTEEIETRKQQMSKRMTKLVTCAQQDMPKPQLFGPENADITIVSWGSNKGSILEAMKTNPNVNYLHITWMSPFPTDEIKKVLEKSKYLLGIESNYTGQLLGLIREKTGIDVADKLLKSDGRPFFAEEIDDKLKSILKGVK